MANLHLVLIQLSKIRPKSKTKTKIKAILHILITRKNLILLAIIPNLQKKNLVMVLAIILSIIVA